MIKEEQPKSLIEEASKKIKWEKDSTEEAKEYVPDLRGRIENLIGSSSPQSSDKSETSYEEETGRGFFEEKAYERIKSLFEPKITEFPVEAENGQYINVKLVKGEFKFDMENRDKANKNLRVFVEGRDEVLRLTEDEAFIDLIDQDVGESSMYEPIESKEMNMDDFTAYHALLNQIENQAATQENS